MGSAPSSQALRISPEDVRERRVVGTLGRDEVYYLQTKGGYNVFATAGRTGIKYLGVGAHPGVARFMAQKAHPELRLTELAKSAWHHLEQSEIDAMLPEAEAVMRLLQS